MASAHTSSDGNGDAEPLPDPDYDHLDFSFNEMEDDDQNSWNNASCCKGNAKLGASCLEEYILGTLILRVVAARDLESVQKGGFGQFIFGGRDNRSSRSKNGHRNGGSANPYASVLYCGQSQRTTEVYDSIDPVWPRGETMYLDVSLPINNMVQEGSDQGSNGESATGFASAGVSQQPSSPLQKPILTVAIFHSNENSSNQQKYPKKNTKEVNGDSDDPFLGMASVDLTSLLTGKIASFDEWLPLSGTENPKGRVRIVCEYEASDPPPRLGDKLRFTSYCNPTDLYPVSPGGTYVVEEVDGDDVIVSYKSPEGWLCTFSGHRFMFICEERHSGAIETYQQELANIKERLSYSPLVRTVADTVEKVPEEGLINIGADAVKGGASLLGRWRKGGVGTAVSDLAHATNWDGRFNSDHPEHSVGLHEEAEDSEQNQTDRSGSPIITHDDLPSSREPLPGMPCCPITGEPMLDPVVAADGHTYEHGAIQRWLKTSDKSPLTGGVLAHKELVSNYMLLSSLQEAASSSSKLEAS